MTKSSTRSNIISPPTFGYADINGLPYKPSLSEIQREWIESINFLNNRIRLLPFIFVVFNLFTLSAFFVFIFSKPSIGALIFFVLATIFLATVYNTIWYHRYCSHCSFEFSSKSICALFLWTNPVFFREESYCIPHRIHHAFTDKAGDPYGPHLGWLGSYLATESQQKINTNMSQDEYYQLCKSLDHIGIEFNDYESFQKSGSVEKCGNFLLRGIVAQIMWALPIYLLGGVESLLAWYSSIFLLTFLMRDFNWRGHGGNYRKTKILGWEYDSSRALNQHFYGYIAGEWHDNHHKYPMSANNGYLRGQVDFAFLIIQMLHKLGLVRGYHDAASFFKGQYLDKQL